VAVPAAWWGAAVVQAPSSFGHALRGELPVELVFTLVNAAQLLAVTLLWAGARRPDGSITVVGYSINITNEREAQACAAAAGRLASLGEMATGLAPEARAVLGHPVALEQVLTNLLVNARDALALAPQGVARTITLTSEAGDGLVRLGVADTGGGIAPEVAARVFEPFVTTKGPDTGTGLGLSISYGLVTAMGGRIAVVNAGAGAVFTITLPQAPADGLA
jgi:signal transduction histidine kinase